MKTRIYLDRGDVVVESDCPFTGDRRTTTYFVPHNGGYVRERDKTGLNPQVCTALGRHGNTIRCPNPSDLLRIIRREYARSQKR